MEELDASSLPFSYNHNVVNGVVFPTSISQQRMDDLATFKLRCGDVFIVTYPKSGTTWMQQIVKLICSGGKDDGKTLPESIPWLEEDWRAENSFDDLPSPRFFKSHTPYHMMPGGPPETSPAKYIYIARNPKDTAVSLFHHTRAFKVYNYTGPWDHFFELFTNGKVESGDWFDHVLTWWKHKDDGNILFLKYEDMKRDIRSAVMATAAFIGRDVSSDTIDEIVQHSRFESMKANPATNTSWMSHVRHSAEPPFMRKGIVGDWVNYFTPEQKEAFDTLYAERMKNSGLEF